MIPALLRLCWPDMTFSTTLISRNSRTFWKVRAMPSSVTWCGFIRMVSVPSRRIEPCCGL